MYAKQIPTAEKKNLKEFIDQVVSKDADLRTDGWNGYKGLKSDYKNHVIENRKRQGKNFKEMHRTIMMFKAWLWGMHHSVRNLQPYLDKYIYRFNRHNMKESIFENLLSRMIEIPPIQYRMMIN